MKPNHNMKCNADQTGTYLDRLAAEAENAAQGAGVRPMAAEALRLRQAQAAAAIPADCGPDIAPSPARGGFVLVRNVELLPVGTDKVEAVHRGYGGREAIRRADAFDAMLAAAARRKQPAPLTPGQIAIGRRYHDLVELLSADGTKLSSLQASKGGPDGRDWMDRRLGLSAELDGMRKRIGSGVAMSVRRVRPSARGATSARIISDRTLLDAVCLKGRGLADVLVFHGWSVKGAHRDALSQALSAALNRMIGYRG
ncbi:hypothetical protein [Paracoccus sp. SM22M-07]|uniref:hypothetical protein n=1 Tax=Paracoccus sp. SM22M-07 TaxID=1520813 RepID=UPI000B33166F|nr:hypothetical protein [Paracoccus sp. SM22M-07]